MLRDTATASKTMKLFFYMPFDLPLINKKEESKNVCTRLAPIKGNLLSDIAFKSSKSIAAFLIFVTVDSSLDLNSTFFTFN